MAVRRSYLSRERTASLPQNHHARDDSAFQRVVAMAWLALLSAGLLEIVWAFFMKRSDGFTLPLPTAITIAAMIASFALLAVAMRLLPLGTAYVVWTGIGAVGAFVLGIAVLGEAVTPLRLAAAGLILAGIVLMKLSAAH